MQRKLLTRIRVDVESVTDLDAGDIHIMVHDELNDKRLMDIFVGKEARKSTTSQQYDWACNGALIYVQDAIMEHKKHGIPSD